MREMPSPDERRDTRSADGRYLIIDGRRWRATDPSIPDPLRQELVNELMSARRAVRSAGDDAEAMAMARSRVDDAKVALGERGHPWWEEPEGQATERRAEAAMRALTRRRGPDKTICPSEVARIVASPDWRPVMELVRSVGRRLAAEGQIVVTKGGRAVDAETVTGPIRYRITEREAT